MNVLPGKISAIESSDHMSIVKVDVKSVILSSVILETPESAVYLEKDQSLEVLFKETEVAIAKGNIGKISLQNQLPCEIRKIKQGQLLSEIELGFHEFTIRSIITTNAMKQLDLTVGEEVKALIKTNEIMLSHD